MARLAYRPKPAEPAQPPPCSGCGAKDAPFGMNFGELHLCGACWRLLPEAQELLAGRLRAALQED